MHYLLPFPWLSLQNKYKTKKDPEEQAKKRLKRDFEFSFNKKDRLYEYQGQEILEKAAIEVVKEHGMAKLKERLEG